MFKRALVILMAVIMVMTATTGLCDAATATDWTAPYKDPVQVHIALEENTTARFADGESMYDNLWTRRFKKLYNIEVIVDWVSTEYTTKLNLAIASNTLPDMFTCNTVQFNQLKDSGKLQPLNDAYAAEASDSLKKMMDNNKDIVATTMSGDNMMAIPMLHYGYTCITTFAWYRDDWAKADNIAEPKKIEDLTAIMDTFKAQNGAKYGLMLEKTLYNFYNMAPAFHAAPQIWLDDGTGNLVYGSVQPAMKDMLKQFADWYAGGYIRSDFGTLDTAAMLEDAYKGNVGLYAQQNWAGWQVGKDMVENAGAGTYFTAHDLPCVDDQKVMFPATFQNDGYEVVNANYSNPEVLPKLMSAYTDVLNDSIKNGTMTKEEVLPFNSNEMHHVIGPFRVHFDSYQDTADVCKAFTTGKEEFTSGYGYVYYDEANKWKTGNDLVGLGRYLQMGYDGASLVRANGYQDNDQILKSKLWGAQPQAMLDYGTTLDDLLTEGFTQIIMGTEDVDYFDTLVENWKMAGGDQVTQAVNEMYGSAAAAK